MGAYIQGGVGDKLVSEGRVDVLVEAVEAIKGHGVPGGIGAHDLEVVMACEKAGFEPDFYMKTLHHNKYWSSRQPGQDRDVIDNRADNYWSMTPEETIEFMKGVKRAWIAFKVLAAGAIHPKSGFKYAFEGGADFVCVGMFDFQVREDAAIAKQILGKMLRRERAWRG